MPEISVFYTSFSKPENKYFLEMSPEMNVLHKKIFVFRLAETDVEN